MMADQCISVYERPGHFGGERIRCTFVRGHTSNHSWRTLELQDLADLEAEQLAAAQAAVAAQVEATRPERPDQYERLEGTMPEGITELQDLLDAITEGKFDPYLQAILNRAHNRKYRLRNVPGF